MFYRQLEHITVALFGSIGSGKSSTGNSILGSKLFRVGMRTIPITIQVETETVCRDNLAIHVIDTPGVQKSSDFSKLRDEIKRILKDQQTGNVTYALVIKVGRYTTEESHVIEDIFKKNKLLLKNTVIIFTNREELYDEENLYDRTVDGWLQKNPSLLALIRNNKLAYRSFENKRRLEEENNIQVHDLISLISEDLNQL